MTISNMRTIDELCIDLLELDKRTDLECSEDDVISDTDFLASNLVDDVNALLATPPSPSYEYRKKLKEYKIECYPGEKDSFGWLVGILELPSGRLIVFG